MLRKRKIVDDIIKKNAITKEVELSMMQNYVSDLIKRRKQDKNKWKNRI